MAAFTIHEKDNVEVLLTAENGIPAGHKVARCDIPKDAPVIKYGFPIGRAKTDIPKGAHVHCHNLYSDMGKTENYSYQPEFADLEPVAPVPFMGYRRKDRKVGIRNEVWIIPTVGCVNGIAKAIAAQSQAFLTDAIDAVVAYTHPYGCSQLGEDHRNTQKLLCGLIRHPNAAGVLVLGLGCENNTMEQMKAQLGAYDEDRVQFLVCQDVEDEIAEGVRLVEALCQNAAQSVRTPCVMSDLVIGLKCGGSDGFFGIMANPLVGAVSGRLIAMGGSALLTEVPEMYGAETLLFNRCRTEEVLHDAVRLINDFKDYFMSYNEPIDENPSTVCI